MTKFSFFITFISLFVAIGLSDMLLSLHKLLRIRKEIRWYWLIMAWSLIIFLFIINMWFGIYHYFETSLVKTSAGFVILLLPVIFLLLSSFAVLPDNPKTGLDLKDWYFKQKKYIFSLLLLNFVSFAVVKILQVGGFHVLIPLSIIIGLTLVLIFTKRQWVHIIITILFLILVVLMMVNQEMYLQ